MDNRKKLIILSVISCIFLTILLLTCWILFAKAKENWENKKNETPDNSEISALLPLVANQKEVNERLDEISKDNKYTLEKAYVELNPYGISPLSGIIIFQSSEEEEVDVYINGEFFTKMASSLTHVIPIYGLYEDYENTIRLVMGSKEATYTMKTSKSNIKYPLNVDVSDASLNDEIFFTEGSMVTGLTGWDKEGKLRFYLTQVLKMDVEWLDNGHFIIGTEQGNDPDGYKALDRYLGFVEMDYLGKVYNYYTMPYGYDFETQILKNGDIMIGGGNAPIYYSEHIIYTFDHENNKVTSKMNLNEAILSVDPNFDSSKLGPSAGKNGFYYDEDTKELVVSFRNLNALISFNYESHKINWVFTNPDNKYFQNEVWSKYLVESDFYPYGQHSPQILGNNTYAMYNNFYDRIDVPTTVKEHKGDYSAGQIFTIKNKKAKLIWSSSSLEELHLTQKFGLFRVLDNKHKLINFGWILHDNYYEDDNNTFQAAEGNVDVTYSIYMELDENNKVLFKANCEEGKYRIFKHSLYNEETANIDIGKLNIYENIESDSYEVKDSKDYDFTNAMEFINYFEYTKNSFYTDMELKEDNDIELLFKNNDKVYVFKYKSKDNTNINRVFNLELPANKYEFYIKIDDVIYKTDKIYIY